MRGLLSNSCAFSLVLMLGRGLPCLPATAADEKESYSFVTMWPDLPEAWGFNAPWDVAVDSAGNVYVADTENHGIKKFDRSGNPLVEWGSEGTGEGEFSSPRALAVDTSGNVFVADGGRIQKFDSSGNFLGEWGRWGSGDGEFTFPEAIAVDLSGNVYVADS